MIKPKSVSFRSLYHFDPSNPPTKAGRYGNSGPSRKKLDRQKSLSNPGKPSYRDNTNNNTNSSAAFEPEKPVAHVKINAPSNVDDQTDMLPLDEPKSFEVSEEVCDAKNDEQECEEEEDEDEGEVDFSV